MSRNVLTIGDLEPERPTVTINRTTPDGWWQRWKFEHLDVLLRWFPVRFEDRTDVYALRLPSEFGLRSRQRIARLAEEVQTLQKDDSPASARRQSQLLREIAGLVLDAPPDVLNSLGPREHLAIMLAFPAAVTGQTPTNQPATGNPPTSDASSPASTASTVPGTG